MFKRGIAARRLIVAVAAALVCASQPCFAQVTLDNTQLQEGDNEVMVWLGQGWYKTTTFHAQYLYPLLRAAERVGAMPKR